MPAAARPRWRRRRSQRRSRSRAGGEHVPRVEVGTAAPQADDVRGGAEHPEQQRGPERAIGVDAADGVVAAVGVGRGAVGVGGPGRAPRNTPATGSQWWARATKRPASRRCGMPPNRGPSPTALAGSSRSPAPVRIVGRPKASTRAALTGSPLALVRKTRFAAGSSWRWRRPLAVVARSGARAVGFVCVLAQHLRRVVLVSAAGGRRSESGACSRRHGRPPDQRPRGSWWWVTRVLWSASSIRITRPSASWRTCVCGVVVRRPSPS